MRTDKFRQEVCRFSFALLPAVKADVDAFVGGAPQFNDITMLALRYHGLTQ